MGGESGQRGSRGRGRGRVKRRNVEAGDGWTVVTHGVEGIALGGREGEEKGQVGKEDGKGTSVMLVPDVVQGLTAEKLLGEFRTLQKRWEGTALAGQIKEVVGTRETWRGAGKVENAVCVGIGSFSRDWVHRWRSLWQLVLFLDMVRHLDPPPSDAAPSPPANGNATPQRPPFPLHAQDPAFTPLDTAFLSLLHIAPSPSGVETHISPTTFLYSPFVDWFLLLPTFLAAPASDPVLYVGNEVLEDYTVYAQTGEKREKLGECNELGKRFLRRRDVRRLVEGEGCAAAVGGMVVGWKRGEEGDGEEG